MAVSNNSWNLNREPPKTQEIRMTGNEVREAIVEYWRRRGFIVNPVNIPMWEGAFITNAQKEQICRGERAA